MFRTMSQFIFSDSIIYYTSYRRTVLINIYKLVDKMPLTVLSLWQLYQLLHARHLFASGILWYSGTNCDIVRNMLDYFYYKLY